MNEKDLQSISKFMSLILRHQPDKIGITLDEKGWADTQALIDGMSRTGRKVTLDTLKEVVTNNNKQRFKFNKDCSKIRANQGHSITVDVEMKEMQPPDVLYHGTATRFLSSIKTDGLTAKNRLHVHLSSDRETAVNVGARHGKPVVLTINANKMYEDGYIFYLSENGVWLTSSVPVSYIWQFTNKGEQDSGQN